MGHVDHRISRSASMRLGAGKLFFSLQKEPLPTASSSRKVTVFSPICGSQIIDIECFKDLVHVRQIATPDSWALGSCLTTIFS